MEPAGISAKFDDTLQTLLFQIVRESLFKLLKHANTLNALVLFMEEDVQICLATVSVGGQRFDSDGIALEKNGHVLC